MPPTPAAGLRYRNAIDPRAYAEAAKRAKGDRLGEGDGVSISSEPLDALALLRERIMLGLRLAEGFDLQACGADLGIEPLTAERTREIERLAAKGRVVREGARLRVPRESWIWTDDTAARLF